MTQAQKQEEQLKAMKAAAERLGATFRVIKQKDLTAEMLKLQEKTNA